MNISLNLPQIQNTNVELVLLCISQLLCIHQYCILDYALKYIFILKYCEFLDCMNLAVPCKTSRTETGVPRGSGIDLQLLEISCIAIVNI